MTRLLSSFVRALPPAIALSLVAADCEPRRVDLEECSVDSHCDYGLRCSDARCVDRVSECTPAQGDCPTGYCDVAAPVARCVNRLSASCDVPDEVAAPRECTSHHQCPTGAQCLDARCRFAVSDDERGYLRQLAFPSAAVLDSIPVAPVGESVQGSTLLSWTAPADRELVGYFLVVITSELPVAAGRGVASYDRIAVGETYVDAGNGSQPSVMVSAVTGGQKLPPGSYSWFVLGYDELDVVAASRVRRLDVTTDLPSAQSCGPDAAGFPQVRTDEAGCQRMCASDEDCLAGDRISLATACLRLEGLGEGGAVVGRCVDPKQTEACTSTP